LLDETERIVRGNAKVAVNAGGRLEKTLCEQVNTDSGEKLLSLLGEDVPRMFWPPK